ncbi:MAG: purine-nucleoside phosphorylase [Meiothermus sp.]|uniref:purine-nucleoside phosphorylase n=1 Tax=Meiothermus sp. TaxID=1955249 RepID=UPI0025EF90DB|nr:purine-nucleoside phosphorylase [Meiothermus sp.]MCS7057778.1 purine-nucleoside phosphorylase [Meiothermus sp.]MCS7194621.1 purine-nucleoside phosphorylase [Meiothermus sp.]MCX7740810.1 purine-nucleoside phosphorylase [Meiothermus sp.]MDW8090970.1 purine-nucleoside phosphorylase [Meiothermus sp.]MDW8481864.1 purine-nucleoside phosphorylase [Meiothermus sp.]
MTPHISAPKEAVAETVLLPGDPLRAKHIAENFLENPVLYNQVRGMLGYTGTYRGRRVSVQGTGMGIPSANIYIHELIRFYGCKTLIRVGTAGAIQPHLRLRDLVIAQAACTDSSLNNLRFGGQNYAPIASFSLLHRAFEEAQRRGMPVYVGNVLSTDTFYPEDPEAYRLWAQYGVLAVEMEAAGLYTLSARFGVEALCILTVSDHLTTGERSTPQERQETFNQMVELALETAVASPG